MPVVALPDGSSRSCDKPVSIADIAADIGPGLTKAALALSDLLFDVYRDFGFEDVLIKLSARPEKCIGSGHLWDKAEKALEDALSERGLD